MLVLAGLMAFWSSDDPSSSGDEATSDSTQSPPSDASAVNNAQADPSAEGNPEAPPATAQEEAVRAVIAESGDGWVQCELPAGLPEIETNALKLAVVQNNVLYMATEEASGTAILRATFQMPTLDLSEITDLQNTWSKQDDPEAMMDLMEAMRAKRERIEERRAELEEMKEKLNNPVAFLSWEGAQPGQQGRCTVQTAVERVEISVVVNWDDGTPASGVRLAGTAFINKTSTADASGQATLWGWQGMSMTIYARNETSQVRVEKTIIASAGKTVSLVMEKPDPDEPAKSMADMMDLYLDEGGEEQLNAKLDKYLEPLQAALEDPDLSEEAREQIQHWMTTATEGIEEALDQIDDMKALMEDLPDHGFDPDF